MAAQAEKIWAFSLPNLKLQSELAGKLKVLPLTAQALINRGVNSVEAAATFLNPRLKDLPNPFLLPDMDKAVERIAQAIAKKESIAIYGDYDADGISATALLSFFFKELGVEVRAYIPDRIKEGYGVQAAALEKLKGEKVSLVITADCGTKSHAALAQARTIGLDVIVTDHHELDGRTPPALAFINPHRAADPKFLELAGCGVAFFLAIALRQKLRQENLFPNAEPNLKRHLDLVALATIADMAPVTGVNRILVSLGLKELAATKKPGLMALKETAGLKDGKALAGADIGFRLGPRLNAGGRIAQAALGLNLLLSESLERAQGLAKILDQCNRERQDLQEAHLEEALVQAEANQNQKGLVVFSKDWHPGIIGLVASRLTENFHRPSIAFCLEGGFARGSARSIPGIHIVEVLEACAEHLEQFGGHALAAGLTVAETKLKSFAQMFVEKIEAASEKKDVLQPSLPIDSEIDLSAISALLLNELELLRPFGIGNPEPVLAVQNAAFKNPRVVGKDHLRLEVSDGVRTFPAIGFRMKGRLPLPITSGRIAFTPQWNEYLGKKEIQLKIKDLKVS